MKILVTVKSVVDVELNIQVEDGAIVQEGLQQVINAWDENAVEAAVVLQEQSGATTELLCIGDEKATVIIRKALAMGIGSGKLVREPEPGKWDAVAYAKIMQKVYEQGRYDLVIMGRQAQDTDSGQTGILLAESADLPCVTNVVGIGMVDAENIKVTRQADRVKEVIELQLPAVITVNDSVNEPRLPALRGIMQAKKKIIENLDLASLGLLANELQSGRTKIIEFKAPQSRTTGQKFEGEATEITTRVVNLLVNEAKVI